MRFRQFDLASLVENVLKLPWFEWLATHQGLANLRVQVAVGDFGQDLNQHVFKLVRLFRRKLAFRFFAAYHPADWISSRPHQSGWIIRITGGHWSARHWSSWRTTRRLVAGTGFCDFFFPEKFFGFHVVVHKYGA